MMYRGMHVAVKQLHITAHLEDVQKEAELTVSMSSVSPLPLWNM